MSRHLCALPAVAATLFLVGAAAGCKSEPLQDPPPPAAVTFLRQGEDHLRAGRLEKARQALETAETNAPRSVQIKMTLGEAYTESQFWERAVSKYQEADLLTEEKRADPRAAIGDVYRRRGLYGKAIAEYDLALERQENHIGSHYGRAVAKYFLGDLDEARRELNVVLTLDPRHVQALIDLGYMDLANGRFEQAFRYFEGAHALDPENARVHYYKGLCYAKQKRYERAVPEFQSCLRKDPNNVNCRNDLAFVYWHMDRVDDAKTEFKRVLEVDPANAFAEEQLKLIAAGRKPGSQPD